MVLSKETRVVFDKETREEKGGKLVERAILRDMNDMMWWECGFGLFDDIQEEEEGIFFLKA